MSLSRLIEVVRKYFNDDDVERLRESQKHLSARFITLLKKPKKILRTSKDLTANDLWLERKAKAINLACGDLFAAK